MKKKYLFVFMAVLAVTICCSFVSANAHHADNELVFQNIESLSNPEGQFEYCYGVGSLDCTFANEKVKWMF